MQPNQNPEDAAKRNSAETEKIENLESPRSAEELKNKAEEIKTAIEEDYNHDQAMIESLAHQDLIQKSLDNPEVKSVLASSTTIEAEAKQEVEKSKSEIDAQARIESPEMTAAEKINLKTNYQEINPSLAAERLKKINPDMQNALSNCGQVFKDCEYPWAMIGSNALVLEADTEKKGDDLDIIFADKDFDKIHENFKKLAAEGKVSQLKITEMVNFKNEKNGCLKISGYMDAGDGNAPIVFEAFAQNIDPEKTPNGIINIGLDQHGVNIYDVTTLNGDSNKVNFLDKKGVEELYLKNLTNEFGLYDLNGWMDKKFLNAKALQRIANLNNLENSIEDIIAKLAEIKPQTEQAKKAQSTLKTLWEEFQSRPESGPGLIKTISDQHNLPENRYRTEKATDIITKESTLDMENIAAVYTEFESQYETAIKSDNKGEIKSALDQLDIKLRELAGIRNKYAEYQKQADKNNPEDFCVYAAMPRLQTYFTTPVIMRMINYRINLKGRLEEAQPEKNQ